MTVITVVSDRVAEMDFLALRTNGVVSDCPGAGCRTTVDHFHIERQPGPRRASDLSAYRDVAGFEKYRYGAASTSRRSTPSGS